MSVPSLRHVLTIGGVEGMAELLVSLPSRLQDGAIRSLLKYLDEEWSTLTESELNELSLPTDESVNRYIEKLHSEISNVQEEISSATGDELENLRAELEDGQSLLTALQERQAKYNN